ncbi:MAG: Kelch repeat-containing protein [Cyclobacteriaceae bacterium]
MKTLLAPIGNKNLFNTLVTTLFLIGIMVFQSCREPVEGPYRLSETELLTSKIWRLESARFQETQLNIINNAISDTVRVTTFEFDANFDSELPVHVSNYFRTPRDCVQTVFDETAFYTDIRFFTTDNNELAVSLQYDNNDVCGSSRFSWTWVQSTLSLIQIIFNNSSAPLFLTSSSSNDGRANYTITTLNESKLILGLQEDVEVSGGLSRYFEELRFVAVNTGICDIDLNVSAIEPASGLPSSRVTLTGNFGQADQVLGVSLFAEEQDYQAENIVQGSSELSFDVPENALPGAYSIRLRFENYEKEIGQTFTVIPSANTTAWMQGPDLPEDRSNQFHFIIDGFLYAGGGFSGYNSFSDVWKIPSADAFWQSVTNLPVPLAYANGVSLNGFGYVLGGGYWDDAAERYIFSDAVYRYDPQRNDWDQVSTFPGGGRQKAIAGVQNGLIYFGGGSSANSFRGDWWSFDPSTDTWTQLFEDLFEIRFDLDARSFSANNRVYFGFGYNEIPTGDIYRQRASGNGFDYAFRIPTEEIGYEAFVAVLNDRLYTGGGFYHAEQGAFTVNNRWYERDFNSTSSVTPGTRRTDHIHPAGNGVSVVAFDSKIWLIGGNTNSETTINDVSIYNPEAEE